MPKPGPFTTNRPFTMNSPKGTMPDRPAPSVQIEAPSRINGKAPRRPQDAVAAAPSPLPSLSSRSRSNRTQCVCVSNCCMCATKNATFRPLESWVCILLPVPMPTRIATPSHSLCSTYVLWSDGVLVGPRAQFCAPARKYFALQSCLQPDLIARP
jgi:hypothetical protein